MTKNQTKKSNSKVPKVTVDELAIMCNKQFVDIAREFYEVRGDIGNVRSDLIELRSEMNYRFDTEVRPLRNEIGEMREDIRGIANKMDSIIFSHRDHEQRISALEQAVI